MTLDRDTEFYENRRRLTAIKALVEDWISKQGHDSCWYYPEIFNQICGILFIPVPNRGLPPRKEFEWGCRKHTDELYQEGQYFIENDPFEGPEKIG